MKEAKCRLPPNSICTTRAIATKAAVSTGRVARSNSGPANNRFGTQYAALAAFEPETIAILDARREAFRARRDYLVPALGFRGTPTGIDIFKVLETGVLPEGAVLKA